MIFGGRRVVGKKQWVFEIMYKEVSLQYLAMQHLQKELEYAFELVSKPDNKLIKLGQAQLSKLKSNIDYPILLLSYLKDSIGYEGKLRAAIQLRIWCDNYKNMEEYERNSYAPIIDDVKTNTLFAFLTFTDKIQQTILPGIVSLTVVEFPDKWNNLIPNLISYATQNPDSTLKILQLVAEITNKYSYLSRSDQLYHQIIIVCDQFQKFLLNLTTYSVENILTNQSNPMQVKILEQEMILFYNLNFQDLHPEFEDNKDAWMNILRHVMKLPSNNQNFFKCKGAALQSILLYASKYKDDVESQVKGFMEQIWTLCANASSDPEYDEIVTNALKYFKSLLLWQDMRANFAANIGNLISNLILPNLGLTDYYKDMFKEDIETFLSYFFRNSETLSRRSNAIDLLQSIVRHFNKPFEAFLEEQVKGFAPSPDNINMQCLLLTLVIESAPKGFRDVDGVTSLHIKPDIIIYCYEQLIKNTLNTIYTKSNENPQKGIQKKMNLNQLLTTLRFIFYFRIYIPTQQLNLLLQLCCGMYSENDSLKEITILVVAGIVGVKHGDFFRYDNIVVYYDEEKIKVVADNVLSMIGRYEKQSEELNASVNRLMLTVVKQLKKTNQLFYSSHTQKILQSMLCKTNVYTFTSVLPLFQAIGYLAYYLSSNKSNQSPVFESMIKLYLQNLINKQSDLLNFCFQILSIFLRFYPSDTGFYENLYLSMIQLQNWSEENLSLFSSYLQYIAAYITLNNNKIIDDKQAYQRILTKLIELDHFELFYRLLRWILKVTNIEGFYKYGYMNVLVRGTQFIMGKSMEGRKMGMLFLFEITFDYSTDIVIKCLNQIENGFYEATLLNNQDIIKGMQLIRNRKMMFGSICNALVIGAFSNVQTVGLMINLLIENTSGRFKRDAIMNKPGSENIIKKESTYQKLSVFKEIDTSDRPVSLDEQMVMLQAYNVCQNKNPDLNTYINQKNMERMKRIYQKNQNQNFAR